MEAKKDSLNTEKYVNLESYHRNKQLHMMLISDEDIKDLEGGKEIIPLPAEEGEDNAQILQLSQCAMAGLTTKKSWKLWGMIGNEKVVILIDCGASHNFISPELISKCGLQQQPTLPYMVEVGDGHKIQQDFFVFSLGSADIVLGLEWLASLGEVRADFGNLRLSIGKGLQEHVLRGDPILSRSESSLKSLWHDFKQQGTCFVIKWEEITHSGTILVPPQVLSILAANEDIFQAIEGLPPSREHDHSIHLQEGAAIPSLLIQEMLQAGVIRPNISPYSSPIILVKKKYGGWRFCIDYRALNKVTIPNKFPIPVIKELLDELAGATMFSKLDLKSGHYEFLVMPFGLTNAPATFQALMNRILQPFLRKFVLVFFDDILIYSPDLGTHVTHLTEVFKVLQQHKLKLNKKKCKVEAMEKWPVPRNPKALRGFLGLIGYYIRFVKGYGKIAKPLTQLLSKEGFHWTAEAQQAFEELKKAVSQLPVLAIPEFSKSFTLETDAFSKDLGAVLLQEGRPLAFWSQALSERGQQKSVYERELMAIVQAVKKWKHYLMDQRLLTEELFKWACKLLGLDFEIRFRHGKDNQVADALSRRDCFKAISILQPEQWASWEEESQQDAGLMALIQDLLLDPSSHEGYELRKVDIVVIFGHLKELRGSFIGRSGSNSVRFVNATKLKHLLQQAYYSLFPFPLKSGKDTILAVVDRLTKYAHFLALAHPFTAAEVAQLFIKEIVKLHGFPSTIVSDRDNIFLSNFWKELFKQAGTQLRFSTAYNPQSDGQTEVVNRCLETYLRCMTGTHPRKWSQWLSWAEFWFNTNYSSSTKMFPFKALYGRDPPLLLKGSTIPSKEQNKKQANKHRTEVEFQVGDWVYLKLQPYRLKSLAKRPNEKLRPIFYGPYVVQERIGPIAYKLDLPAHSRIHPPLPPTLTEELMLEVSPEELLDVRTSPTGDLKVLIKWQHLPSIENSWESPAAINTKFPAFHLEDKVTLHEGVLICT
ncbi:hypothetical protein V8G54_036682 [Vigna mungo]|uniref:Uncharacterized protein n=1 Tax=Vigna mungo TaxID=3915 RepID=A0AAQ3RFP1_VIGMU